MANKSLGAAKAAKNDEFYTRFDDVQKELNHYVDQFRGKVVYCNCDDPAESAFSDFFKLNFNHFGLKKLICTRYAESTLFDQFDFDRVRMRGYKLEITSPNDCRKTPLKGNGDFRSAECIELLKQADIVVTNPPFSLFREYIALLIEHNKKFLAIGSINAITYKEIFPLIKDNELWGGYTNPKEFRRPDESIEKLGNCQWWTNLDVKKRHEFLPLYEKYDPVKYPCYDNYDAINVDKTNEIPPDYDGVMGVPISFLDKYNPEQFEILGMTTGRDEFGVAPSKRYINARQINKDGSVANGSKANTRATVLTEKVPDGVYYVADNAEGYLTIFYARILIKRKAKDAA